MSDDRKWSWPRWSYLLLALVVGALAVFHFQTLNAALERTRLFGGLMPIDALSLKYFGGELATLVAGGLLLAFVASARCDWLRKDRTVAHTSTAAAVFLGLYAFLCALELSINLRWPAAS